MTEKNEKHIAIETEALSVGYGSHVVLSDGCFFVRTGEVTVLMGANGSGKSTLLKSLSGYLAPLFGCVKIDGQDLSFYDGPALAKERALMLTERPKGELITCRQLVAAGRYPYTGRLGILSEGDWKKVDEALLKLDASALADKPFTEISDGQKQRILLARALAQEPKILFLDEPVSFLDIRFQLETLKLIRRLAKEEDVCVIISLHEIDLIRRAADRCICLKEGQINKIGTPDEVLVNEYIEYLYEIPEGEYGEKRGLKKGYTTGTCAALAAKGAAVRLLSGAWQETETLIVPGGMRISVPLLQKEASEQEAVCGVKKDAGDDPDVTDGMIITAAVKKCSKPGIEIKGGDGIGTVTAPGLDQPVGEAAINSVPRRMITEAILSVCEAYGYKDGLSVTVSAPNGEEIAKKTFNPELGIVGGISILGTSGIVEPMSERALVESIKARIAQRRAEGGRVLILVPGNAGERDLLRELPFLSKRQIVKCSNFIGSALDLAADHGFSDILLAGEVGKLIKLSGGIFTTHSKDADARRELFALHTALCGRSDLSEGLLATKTAEECVQLLAEEGVLTKVTERILASIDSYMERRLKGRARCGVMIFSAKVGRLGETSETAHIIKLLSGE